MPRSLSSNQVSSKTRQEATLIASKLNVVYWLRIAAGILAGFVSGVYHWELPQPLGGVLVAVVVYIATVILAMLVFHGSEKPRKLYVHGIGGYIIWWFVVYSAYLSLVYSLS